MISAWKFLLGCVRTIHTVVGRNVRIHMHNDQARYKKYGMFLGPAQDVPCTLILWYVLKIIYFTVVIGPILNKELKFIFRSDHSSYVHS